MGVGVRAAGAGVAVPVKSHPSFSVRGSRPFSSFHLRDLSKSGASQGRGLSLFGKPYAVSVPSPGYTLEVVFW